MYFLHICKHSSVDSHFSQCPCRSICSKNKETSSQPLAEKYKFRLSHILWESIPTYYGNLFPQNKGIFSQALGNLFPQYVGILSHNIWDNRNLLTFYFTTRIEYRRRLRIVKGVKDVKRRLFLNPSQKAPVKQTVTDREGCEGEKLNFIIEL